METSTLTLGLFLFGAAFLGALPPLYRRWSDRGLHQFVALSAGIFLGFLFLHLLPELAAVGLAPGNQGGPAEPGHSGHLGHAGDAAGSLTPWVALLSGFLLLFAIERVWLQNRGPKEGADPHSVLLSATFVGLGLHAFTMGIGLSALTRGAEGEWPVLLAVLYHKAAEAFSLAAVMRLAGLRRRRALPLLGLFALCTPVGLVAGSMFATSGPALTVLTGFASGTFLYVAVCDLLPEIFHHREQSWTKLGWVVAGIVLTALTLPQAAGTATFVADAVREGGGAFVQMAPYLLLGFLIAGVLSQVLKPEMLTRHLARDDARAVAKASIVGAPLPLCSCSVVPVAVSLRKAGASKGATSAFLIATPETGVDSVSVTWALLDPVMTIVRPLGAIVSAFFTGGLVNLFVRGGFDRTEGDAGAELDEAAEPECCDTPAPTSCCEDTVADDEASPERSAGFVERVLRFAFVDMVDDLAGLLLVGILLSGVISAAVPASFFEQPVAQGFSGLLLMLVVGIPIYVCAAASTPIAASLILKGLSPGAALVFLLASPATNLASLVAVSRTLGRRVLLFHVTALAVVTVGLGALVDALYPALGIEPSAAMGPEHSMSTSWFTGGCAVVFAALALLSILRTRFGLRWPGLASAGGTLGAGRSNP